MGRRKLWFALAAAGVIGGLVGIVLTELMHFIQHTAYGYGADGAYISFREGVARASEGRRLGVLILCGMLAGGGWWLLKALGKPLIGIKAALKQPLQGLPFLTTVFHVLLQIITVGLGSPLGREVAPREMTAAFAFAGGRRLGLDEDEMRLLIACASGAGLAAVYNVPLASTLFILEAMLGVWTQQAVAAALLTSVIATAVARIGLGDVQQYHHLITLVFRRHRPDTGRNRRLFPAYRPKIPLHQARQYQNHSLGSLHVCIHRRDCRLVSRNFGQRQSRQPTDL